MYILTQVRYWGEYNDCVPNVAIIEFDESKALFMLSVIKAWEHTKINYPSLGKMSFHDSIKWMYTESGLYTNKDLVKEEPELQGMDRRGVEAERMNIGPYGVYWSGYFKGATSRVETLLISKKLIEEAVNLTQIKEG